MKTRLDTFLLCFHNILNLPQTQFSVIWQYLSICLYSCSYRGKVVPGLGEILYETGEIEMSEGKG